MSSVMLTAVRADGLEFIPVHYLYRSAPGTTASEGKPLRSGYTLKIACAPNLEEFHAANGRACPFPRSEDTQAVTCPMCMATDEFKKAKKAYAKGTR